MNKQRNVSIVVLIATFFHKYEKLFVSLLSLIIITNIFFTVYQNLGLYTSHNYWSRYPELKREYYASQYGRKKPELYLHDEVVNAYAGGAQITGISPIFIAPDTPPLGRYLIGVSAYFFNNENIITLICACSSLLLMFLIGRQIYSSTFLSLIPPLLFSFEPMFKNQLKFTPLLDIQQLVCLLAVFYFFNKTWSEKKYSFLYYFMTSFFIGCFVSIKFFATGATIVLALYVVLFIHKRLHSLFIFTLSLSLAVLILLSTYLTVFYHGYTFMRFLGIQRWVLEYHKSQLILPFSIWPLILINKWYVWFGDKPVISDAQWRLTWPLVTLSWFFGSVIYVLNKLNHRKEVEILFIWIGCYFLFFSVGQISARYFVILIPILYLVTVYLLENLFLLFSRK
jgi:hypothetical protein